ncbi:hypothetical protein JZ751_009129 [Albula glossodonta]|uniref:Uncharacterized protein n=1 Tax=Albula glossodonta TaxID=121402 RepID=A0A8T2MLT5_9TELE|nr:hypothetical protein JZ751_009129 [Albula glossodonta]
MSNSRQDFLRPEDQPGQSGLRSAMTSLAFTLTARSALCRRGRRLSAPPPNRQLLSSPALLVPLGQTLRSAKGQTCSWATGACGEEDRPARQDVDCSPTWGQAPPPLPFPSSGQADGGPFPGNLSPEVRGHL